MIVLCKHLMDSGACKIKKTDDFHYENCPAVDTTGGVFGDITHIQYSLMQMMACSDKWEDARKEVQESEPTATVSFTCTGVTFTDEGVEPAAKSPEIHTKDEARQDIDDFIDSLPAHACSKCEREFHAENPPKIDGDIVCSDCHFDYNKMCKFNPDMPRGIDGDDECIKCPGCDMVYSNVDAVHETELCPICRRREENVGKGTHPDPEQYHCQECGCIYPAEFKETRGDKTMCSSCWATEDNQKAGHSEPELEYTQIKGNVYAAVSGETVHLKYKDNYLDAWDRTVFETLLDMDKNKRRKEIDKLVEGMKYQQMRRTCLKQFVDALGRGDVKYWDGDA